MSFVMQDAMVTLIAAGAAGILVRRVLGVFRPAGDHQGCSSCPSCAPHGGPPALGTPGAGRQDAGRERRHIPLRHIQS